MMQYAASPPDAKRASTLVPAVTPTQRRSAPSWVPRWLQFCQPRSARNSKYAIRDAVCDRQAQAGQRNRTFCYAPDEAAIQHRSVPRFGDVYTNSRNRNLV